MGSQVPRIWTPRDPQLFKSHGGTLERVASLAGIDLDEWQTLTTDVALEYDPDTGKWVHRTVVLLVARQNGKTVILEARILFGLFAVPDERLILHTAQDRAVPRELFEALVTRIGDTRSLHKRVAKIRETNGQEQIKLKDGSRYRIVAPRAKAFRSWSADLLIFDEAREQHDDALWGAAIPTQRTRPNPQTWAVSNAGDPDSVVLNRLRDRGRAAADDPASDRQIAYLEWSAPDDAALDDRAGWVAANPSLGHRLSGSAIVEELRSLSENRFRTEILCQWIQVVTDHAIDVAAWAQRAGSPDVVNPSQLPRPVAGVHVSPDRTYAALVIATDRDERLVIDVADEWQDPEGVDVLQVARDVTAWCKAYRIRQVAYDRAAASVIASHVAQRGIDPQRMDTIEYVTASQNLNDAIATGYLIHRSHPTLETQVRRAGRATRQDGTEYLSQAQSSGDITAVIAAAFAVNLAYRPRKRSSVAAAPDD